VRRLAEQLNTWGERCRRGGLALGYHGYHPIELEFAPLNGGSMYDLMVAETDPGLVDLQIDTYWLHYVGRSPVEALRQYAGRVPTLHVKDSVGGQSAGDTPIGDGVIPWPEVLAAARVAGTNWLIVEQEDEPEFAGRDIRRSLHYLEDLLASTPGDEVL
jgi:sugar phosphate isomerase/epimerase